MTKRNARDQTLDVPRKHVIFALNVIGRRRCILLATCVKQFKLKVEEDCMVVVVLDMAYWKQTWVEA